MAINVVVHLNVKVVYSKAHILENYVLTCQFVKWLLNLTICISLPVASTFKNWLGSASPAGHFVSVAF